jgi:hypothetical protein
VGPRAGLDRCGKCRPIGIRSPDALHAPPISFSVLTPEQYSVSSTDHEDPHYEVFSSPVSSSLLGPNVLLNTLFSNTLSSRSSLNLRDQVSHPYKNRGRIRVICDCIPVGPVAQPVYRLATVWMVRRWNPGGGEIFRARPDRPWGPPSLLYIEYQVFPGGKAAGAWC